MNQLRNINTNIGKLEQSIKLPLGFYIVRFKAGLPAGKHN